MTVSDTQISVLKHTPLHSIHISLGAKMAPFGGFDMPIQYAGIIQEHMATRNQVTIFDTCHMGEFQLSGQSVVTDLENILSCPVGSIQIGQCKYGYICNEAGGAIDDQIIYRLEENEFFMVVNASTQHADFEWIKSHISGNTFAENISDETAKIDLQGPQSPKIMQTLMDQPVDDMKFYRFMHNIYRGKKILTSRTGYTGEIGFEIYCDPETAKSFFNDCLEKGALPAGLGARDTLRLEMGMPLYGHELNETRNPAQAGFVRAIDATKKFIGSDIVLDEHRAPDILVGMILETRRAARSNDPIINADGEHIGMVTSGSYSPCCEKAVALGYVPKKYDAVSTQLFIDTGRQKLGATVTELPFYKNATGRKAIGQFLS